MNDEKLRKKGAVCPLDKKILSGGENMIETRDVIDIKAICIYINDEKYLFSINDTQIEWSIVDKSALIVHRAPNDPVCNQQIDDELERRKGAVCP